MRVSNAHVFGYKNADSEAYQIGFFYNISQFLSFSICRFYSCWGRVYVLISKLTKRTLEPRYIFAVKILK